MEDSATCCSRPVLKLKIGNMHGFFVEPLGHVITLRGQILASRTDDDRPSPLLRVYVQNVPVCTGAAQSDGQFVA